MKINPPRLPPPSICTLESHERLPVVSRECHGLGSQAPGSTSGRGGGADLESPARGGQGGGRAAARPHAPPEYSRRLPSAAKSQGGDVRMLEAPQGASLRAPGTPSARRKCRHPRPGAAEALPRPPSQSAIVSAAQSLAAHIEGRRRTPRSTADFFSHPVQNLRLFGTF